MNMTLCSFVMFILFLYRKNDGIDGYSGKEKNSNRVDLVRLSRSRNDTYDKREMVNEWLDSKHLVIPRNNFDLPYNKHSQVRRFC